jgi:hypothetical protein
LLVLLLVGRAGGPALTAFVLRRYVIEAGNGESTPIESLVIVIDRTDDRAVVARLELAGFDRRGAAGTARRTAGWETGSTRGSAREP